MKIFGISIPFTKRASPSVTDDRWWTGSPFVYLGDEPPVTPETALRFTAVFAAVRVIAGNLASLPLITFERRSDGGKEKATKHPLYKILKTKPNQRKTTAFEFREMLTGHMLLYGNGYAQIIRNGIGEPLELYPLHPSRVTPTAEGGEVIYKVKTDDGQTVKLPEYQVLHLRAYRDSGLEGLSPVAAARRAIEAGLSLESFASNFFQGGAFPAGVLEYEGQGEMPPEARDNLRDSWEKLHGGANRGKKVAVLEAGVKWKPMGIPQQDAQFLEQRRFGVEEIARIYGVPPHLLGDLSRSTNNNIETQSQEFLTYCLRPWMERWEQAIVRDLLDGEDEEYFVKHVANALLRGDSASRAQFYATGRQWGWFSINEIRALEELNPIGPDGDIHLSPLNMIPAGDEGKVLEEQKKNDDDRGQEKAQGNGDSEPNDQGQRSNQLSDDAQAQGEEKIKAAFRGALLETWTRVVRKEVNAIKTAARKKGEEFDPWFDEFIADHRGFASECLKELVRGYCNLRGVDGDAVLPDLVDEYKISVRDSVDAWKAEPSQGYSRREDEIAAYWTERVLGYSQGEYGTAA